MWLLSKHPPTEDSETCVEFTLLEGREYVVGRKDCDIILHGDASISRKHGIIKVSKTVKGEGKVTLKDTSKIGIQVNDRKITRDEEISIKELDVLCFGKLLRLRLTHVPINIVTSCVNKSDQKGHLKNVIQKLGGNYLNEWRKQVSHLVMQKLTFTIKVVCALASGKPIVTVKYFEDMLDCCDKKMNSKMPSDVNSYLPPIDEENLRGKENLLLCDEKRKSLFDGKTFISLHEKQFKRIKAAIEMAGGKILLKDKKDLQIFKNISTNQILVMFVETKDERQSSGEQKEWIKEIYIKLKKVNLRAIRESEIGLAILNSSLQEFCNPATKAPPSLTSSTHSQVLQDTMVPGSQMSQVQGTQILVSQTAECKVMEVKEKKENQVKRKLNDLEDEASPRKTKIIKIDEIKIEDDDELEQSLSNVETFDMKLPPDEKISSNRRKNRLENEYSSDVSTVYNKTRSSIFVNDTVKTNAPQVRSSQYLPLDKKSEVQDSMSNIAEDKDDDIFANPFDFDIPSFSEISQTPGIPTSGVSRNVNIIADSPPKTTLKNDSKEILKSRVDLTTNEKKSLFDSNQVETGKSLFSDKPSTKKVDIAISDDDDLVMDDVANELLGEKNEDSEKHVTKSREENFSNVLDTKVDDILIINQLSPEKRRVQVDSDGFICMKQKKSNISPKLENDLDDIPNDLIQVEHVPLVNKKNDQINSENIGKTKKKGKNFKCFKKQRYAECSRMIKRSALVVFESNNEEKSALFDEFREEIEQEEEDRRNADALFNWQSMET